MAEGNSKDDQIVGEDILLELRDSISKDWLDVGRKLKLNEATLQNIKTDNSGRQREAVYQMLLEWKRVNREHATISFLQRALLEADRADLAHLLKRKFPSSDAVVQKVPRLDLAETRPALQYCMATLSDVVQLNPHLLANTKAVNADNSNIFINSTINQNYVPKNQVGQRQQLTPDEKKPRFLEELKNGYRKQCGGIQPVSFLRTQYAINDLFVEGGIKVLEEKHGESKEQEKWVELGNYSTIFTDHKAKSKRRILDGEPGYGKSSLALQITHDWCHEKAWVKDFEVLILLRLRQFKKVPSVSSAIKSFLLPKDSKLTEEDIKNILDSSSTLILLDGYDEYPDRQNEDTDINHIIRGDMFQEHEVILTTRTSCLPPDHENTTVKRIRLTGFDETSREAYIRNVVARGCSEIADKIRRFLKENTAVDDFIQIPLFFAMVCNMVKISERFRHLETVTQFFRHIIKCLCSNRETEGNRVEERDHSKLDEVAFEGLRDDVQQISWEKGKLRDKIGKDLYEEYVRTGILIEEEGFDFDTFEYNTETRFFHKLFAEWHAACYLAKAAAEQVAQFEPWPEYGYAPWRVSRNQQTEKSQPSPKATDSDRVHLLKSLNPHDVHYMYRYACGLNPEAGLKIIRHLGTNEDYNQYTLLCMTEWAGGLHTIKDTVNSLCSGSIGFIKDDSLLLQKSTLKLLKFASDKKIPIYQVWLRDCIRVSDTGDPRVMPSNLPLPVFNTTLSKLRIYELGRVFTEEETVGILQYAAMCPGLEALRFVNCLLPRSIKRGDLLSALKTNNVRVEWWPVTGTYLLYYESGEWEDDERNFEPMTDDQYQKAERKVHKFAEGIFYFSDSEESDEDGDESTSSSESSGKSDVRVYKCDVIS